MLAGGKGEAIPALCPRDVVKAVGFGCQEGHSACFEQPVELLLRKALHGMHAGLEALPSL